MPPLRERKTDILLLADYFLEKYAKENHKDIRRFSTPAIDMLMQYHWPGNVRELENCIERAVLVCEEGVIHSYHLPPTLQTGKESGTLPGPLARGRRGQPRKGDADRRPQEHPRQHHQRRQDPPDHRAQVRVQGAAVRHRLPALPLTAAPEAHLCLHITPRALRHPCR